MCALMSHPLVNENGEKHRSAAFTPLQRAILTRAGISTPRAQAVLAVKRRERRAPMLLIFCVVCSIFHLLTPPFASAATQSTKVAIAPKWTRFEQSFKSTMAYANPWQQASLQVTFISPSGKTNQVYGFWDGGKVWKVRFTPDEIGRWSFHATCSDPLNRGLHNQKGEVVCTAAIRGSNFHEHGSIRVAADHRHFEYADGTPFFWLADTTWRGMQAAEAKDLSDYAAIRISQKFSVIQWSLSRGETGGDQGAWSGTNRITIHPEFFQRLESRLDTLRRAGLLSAIAPLIELNTGRKPTDRLPDDQAALLLRYVVARWNADPVAWLLIFEGDGHGITANRWKKIGQSVFGNWHAPVVLFTADTPWLVNEFRDQLWIDAFAYQTLTDKSDDAAKWATSGPLSIEWKNSPARPVIAFTPPENGSIEGTDKRFSADDVRRAAWWSLLLTPPAGISYSANAVLDWDITTDASRIPLWRRSLFMPAAKQMLHLSHFMDSSASWKLRPRPESVASQPGTVSPRSFVAAAATDNNSLTVFYTPQERTLDILKSQMPLSPNISWLNPRTGAVNAAVAVVGETSCQLPTPDPGDWLLIMRAGK
jgi:hypothetical protein